MNSILNRYYLLSHKRHADLIFQTKPFDGLSPMGRFPICLSAKLSGFQILHYKNGLTTEHDIMIRAWSWCPPIQEKAYATL